MKILIWIVAILLFIIIAVTVTAGSWVRGKIETAFNDANQDLTLKIAKVHLSMIKSRIEIEGATISSRQDHGDDRKIAMEMATLKIRGIDLVETIFNRSIDIGEVIISGLNIQAKGLLFRKTKPLVVSPVNIRIGRLLFEKVNLVMGSASNAQSLSIHGGVLNIFNLLVVKQDTISLSLIKVFDFDVKQIVTISADSMYTISACGMSYSANPNTLGVKTFSIQPNYSKYKFTSRFEYQKDRFEGSFSDMYIHDFNTSDFFKSGSLISPYIEIGKMDLKVFRDKRKKIRHVRKPVLQEIIYNYPGTVRIDSIAIITGNVVYTEHGSEANEPGSISFDEIKAGIFNITNDTLTKADGASLVLKGNAFLMGKGKLTILLKAELFNSHNPFSLEGTLSGLEAKELNPILEKSAFIYVTSGKIDRMNFKFSANNIKSSGKMTLLYHGLDIAVKNKLTDDTTAFRERFISFMVNRKLLDSNPLPNEQVRKGTIYYVRDPEKFLFGYCFRSILSGIKSSLVKSTGFFD